MSKQHEINSVWISRAGRTTRRISHIGRVGPGYTWRIPVERALQWLGDGKAGFWMTLGNAPAQLVALEDGQLGLRLRDGERVVPLSGLHFSRVA